MQVTVTQFSGGVTNYVNPEAIRGLSKYLIGLCGKYGRTAEDILKPKISLVKDTNSYSFGNVPFNTFSVIKKFNIVCTNLNGGITLNFNSLQSDFQISNDSVSWGSSYSVQITDNIFLSSVYVRFSPQSLGLIKGDFVINNGSLNKIIYLSGIGI